MLMKDTLLSDEQYRSGEDRNITRETEEIDATDTQLDSKNRKNSDDQLMLYEVPDDNNISGRVMRKLVIASIIGFIFFVAEVAGGVISGSLAIISDAAHMFSDLSGFVISITAVWMGRKPASQLLGYGYQRSEVIGAMGSITLIWILTIYLVYEATHRIINKEPVGDPLVMLITAAFGLICNIVMAKVLHSQPTITHQCSHDHGHGHSHGHSHGHGHGHSHGHGGCKGHGNHSHSHDHDHDHDHKHENHDHNHAHSHSHDHDHEHGCSGHNHKEQNQRERKDSSESKISLQPMTQLNDEKPKISPRKSRKSQSKNLSQIEEHENYNLRAAMIHVIGDIIQSIGVLIAAILIYIFGNTQNHDGDVKWNPWHLADPICTYIFSIIVLFTTIKVARDCLIVLMEGTPNDLDVHILKNQFLSIENVTSIHDLHVWQISVGKPVLSCHIVVNNLKENQQQALVEATNISRSFGIYHSTIQIEDEEKISQVGYIKCDQNIHKEQIL